MHADVVIYCTGYKITFPFFDEDFISAPDNHIELFWRVFDAGHPRTSRSSGCSSRSARSCRSPRRRGEWVAEYLRGEYRAAVARGRCATTSRKDMAAMRKRYVSSKRHTIQVDFDEYLFKLAERAPGGRRARGRGRARPRGAVAA